MNILHLSTRDVVGGAAIAAYRLHDGLRRSGVQSRMLVRARASADADVLAATQDASLLARFRRRLDQARLVAEMAPYAKSISPTLELFSGDRAPRVDLFHDSVLQADVLNLHWVAEFLDYRGFFARRSPDAPLVWTLHDMNPMTGGCHYSLGCERFVDGCGACPQLGSLKKNDSSARIHARKRAALGHRWPESTRIVAPSRWLVGEARRSELLRRFNVDVIPNGLDTEVFCPRDRQVARQVFGLPLEGPVVLFAADAVGNHRKGFDLLTKAARALPPVLGVTLAAVGGAPHGEHLPGGAIALGRIDSPRLLSFAYSAADLFVLPTRADNLPNVALEAMACGTPIVGFDVGGMPDIVRPSLTGLLAQPEDVAGLREAIVTLLANNQLRSGMAIECRRLAVDEYALEHQVHRYRNLYLELIEARARNSRGRRSRTIDAKPDTFRITSSATR